jgi:hypothetical protein
MATQCIKKPQPPRFAAGWMNHGASPASEGAYKL